MAKKYIDAMLAEQAMQRLEDDDFEQYGGVHIPEGFDGERAIEALRAIPAADVEEVKHGEWLEGNKWQPCSECHRRGKKSWKYCPSCGAKMDVKASGASPRPTEESEEEA